MRLGKHRKWQWLVIAAMTCLGGPAIRAALVEPADETPTTQPLDDLAIVSIDDDIRYQPTSRPSTPRPQFPAKPTTENVDTGKPVHEWQRATDDWFGYRPSLEEKGIAIQPSLEVLLGHNTHGGASTTGIDGAYLFNFNITLDTEKLLGLEGGTVFANFLTQDGADEEQSGAFQTTSDVSIGAVTELSEFWYEQKLLDHKVRVKLGKIDVNSEFAAPPYGEEFLNGSTAFSPTILSIPEGSDTAFGANVFVYPTDRFYAGVGVYDGALQAGYNTGGNGPATTFGPPDDAFVIGETGVTWDGGDSGRDGKVALGYWYHSGHFDRFDGGVDHGTSGPYVYASQTLWKANPGDENDDRAVGIFAQYGYADPSVSLAEHHVGAGIVWLGPIPGRDEDQLGASVNWIRFTDANGADLSHHTETAIELYYKGQLLKWLSVKPDVQYIIHPGGTDEGDAVQFTIQFVADF